MEIVPFTIDLVEPHCKRYWRHEANESFVLTNDAAQDAFVRAQERQS